MVRSQPASICDKGDLFVVANWLLKFWRGIILWKIVMLEQQHSCDLHLVIIEISLLQYMDTAAEPTQAPASSPSIDFLTGGAFAAPRQLDSDNFSTCFQNPGRLAGEK